MFGPTIADGAQAQVRVHDLKHTFGYRLRAAGACFEDRQDLLGHKSQRITTHYSAPDVNRLIAAAEKVVDIRAEPMLRVVHVEAPHNSPTDRCTSTPQSSEVLDLIGGDGWILNNAIFTVTRSGAGKIMAEYMRSGTEGFAKLATDPGIMRALYQL